MNKTWLTSKIKHITIVIVVFSAVCPALAQEFTVAMFRPETIEAAPPAKPVQPAPLPEQTGHKFWDGKNKALFAVAAASAGADFAVTRANLGSGGKELNPITRLFAGSTTGLAVNFAGETAGTLGLSYVFHKTGHHKLERLTPMVNIGSSLFAVGYGLAHR